jgi:methyltransferase-like protein
MDGTRDRAALAEQVTAMVREGVVTLRHDGKPIDDPRLLRALADRIVDGCVRSLASAGLLTA